MTRQHAIRIQNHARVGTLQLTDDTTGLQRMQIQLNAYETMDQTPSIQHFGFTSSPPMGTNCTVLCLSGDNSNSVVIGTNHYATRPIGLGVGETCVYDANGQKVFLSDQDGTLAIQIIGGQQVNITASSQINATVGSVSVAMSTSAIHLNAPDVYISNNLHVGNTIQATGDMTANGHSMTNHVHSGVQTGGGSTGKAVG